MARPAGSDVERRRRSDRRAAARARDGAVTPRPAPQAADVAAAAQLACLLEASAPKPGNVSPFASFRDTSYEDFLARDRKSTRLNSSHSQNSYAVFCLKKKIYKYIIHSLLLSLHLK